MSCNVPERITGKKWGSLRYEQEEKMNIDIPVYSNVLAHKDLCEKLNRTYEIKNHDYGDSFHLSFKEEGFAMARVRLTDKLNRFKTLSRGTDISVKDESIRDTLMDLANYAIMTVLEMDRMDIPKEAFLTSDEDGDNPRVVYKSVPQDPLGGYNGILKPHNGLINVSADFCDDK